MVIRLRRDNFVWNPYVNLIDDVTNFVLEPSNFRSDLEVSWWKFIWQFYIFWGAFEKKFDIVSWNVFSITRCYCSNNWWGLYSNSLPCQRLGKFLQMICVIRYQQPSIKGLYFPLIEAFFSPLYSYLVSICQYFFFSWICDWI